MLRQAGRHLLQGGRQCSCSQLGASSSRASQAAVLDVRRGFAEDPKPGARGKGGGETDKQQPSEEHTKNPDKADKKSKDPHSQVENPIEELNANTVESVNTPDDKEAPKHNT